MTSPSYMGSGPAQQFNPPQLPESWGMEQNRIGNLQQRQNSLWRDIPQQQYAPQPVPVQSPTQGFGSSAPAAPLPQYAPPQAPGGFGTGGYGGSGLSSMVSNRARMGGRDGGGRYGNNQQTGSMQGRRREYHDPYDPTIMPIMHYDPKPFDSLTGQDAYDYYDQISKLNPYVQAPAGYGDYMTQKTGTPWINPNPDTMDFSNDYYSYFDKLQASNPSAGYVVPRGYNTWKSQQP